MTGNAPVHRLPSVRRVTCGGCKKSFIPRRRGAVFCSGRCQKAEYRWRELRAEAEKTFKTDLTIAQNTAANAFAREMNASWAQHLGQFYNDVGDGRYARI
jgi:hypothetical protein